MRDIKSIIKLGVSGIEELIRGYLFLSNQERIVTIYGSARSTTSDFSYLEARMVGRKLATMGFAVLNGGGPGIMEAVSRGVRDEKGIALGCNIVLTKEEIPNRFLTNCITVKHFFSRKIILQMYSKAFVFFSGGFGTMDELFEIITLIQNGKMRYRPVILIGMDYFNSFKDQLDIMEEEGMIDSRDKNRIVITDDIGQIETILNTISVE